MDEIEYKLNTSNSVVVVNGIDKLLSTIKSKYRPAERQKFVMENEELKFLREKCSVKNSLVSLTACQGLLALVELGVLEIGHTMSTVVTLLPSSHNYSAIISTMAGLLILDLKSRLVPGQPYKCQFSLKSPQHPFITVLEKNKEAEDEVLTQMHALCTHPDYIVSSNSLELLRAVFLWLTCNPQRSSSIRPWQLLLSLPQSTVHSALLLACITCQQINNPDQLDGAFAAYSVVADRAIYQQHREHVMALLPILARISNELTVHGRDPRLCYSLMERCFSLEARELQAAAGLTLMVLAHNLARSSALHLHQLFNLCLNIINKYEYSSLSLNVFVALTLQWLYLPSYLTSSALKVASKIIDIQKTINKCDSRLHIPNLKANKTFQSLMYTDSKLSMLVHLNQTWERVRDHPEKLQKWFDSLESVDDFLKLDLVPFLCGMVLEKRADVGFEDVVVRSIRMLVGLVDVKKDLAVQLLPILLYKIANEPSPVVKLECLRALPLMAKSKENVPTLVSVLNKLKVNKGVPLSFLIILYGSLAETQVRCFPYLREVLADMSIGRPDELKWENDIACAVVVNRICELRPSTNGIELVSVISSILNRCTDRGGAAATSIALSALRHLWLAAAVAPPSTWRALEPKLGRDNRPAVIISMCKLLGEVPALRVSTPEYDQLITEAARRLWCYIADGHHPEAVEAACDALAAYKIEDYTLKDIPAIYRKTVRLPGSYCKTPADAALRPEDVLDYVPCEVWPEVFMYTNSSALYGVQRLAKRLVEREIKTYRSGVYQTEKGMEPLTASYLPASSVVRGLMDFFKKQASHPSYVYEEIIIIAILETLTEEYPRPLHLMNLCFLHEAILRGANWKPGCVKLAARQVQVSVSGRRLLDMYLQKIHQGTADESDVLLMFELLPLLCRGMPPNSLRPPLERCLGEAFSAVASVRAKNHEQQEEYLFITQLKMISTALKYDKIHDANRTLLSQIVENYYPEISHDNVAWSTYMEVCTLLSVKYLERMTSPTSWWETTDDLLIKTCSVRTALALIQESDDASECSAPLVWLNEIIDAVASQITIHEYSLRCMMSALKAANPDHISTRDWFMQLMARTQVAFNEYENSRAKLYYVDVFTLSVIMFSGHWSFEPDSEEYLLSSRANRLSLLPAAITALLARDLWRETTLQTLECLAHTRDRWSVVDTGAGADVALCCQRALLALRHTPPFAKHKLWTRMEKFFGSTAMIADD